MREGQAPRDEDLAGDASPRASPPGHAGSGGCAGAARLDLLDETYLAHAYAAELRHAV